MRKFLPIAVLLTLFLALGCAQTRVEPAKGQSETKTAPAQPNYSGPKMTVAVLPLGLSEKTARRYPKLADKAVGLGMHNMLLDALFDTGRFRFVEENPEIMKDVMERQWLSGAGFVTQNQAVEYGRILGAEKVIYGEVFDYAEGGESVSGLSARSGFNVRVGVQVVCTDIATAEKIALGTATATATSYTEGAQSAISRAVGELIRRLNAR